MILSGVRSVVLKTETVEVVRCRSRSSGQKLSEVRAVRSTLRLIHLIYAGFVWFQVDKAGR